MSTKTIKVQINDDFTGTCRKLLEDGEDPSTQLEMYRKDMLCLSGNIGKCAKLTVEESKKKGPRFRKYSPFPGNAVLDTI